MHTSLLDTLEKLISFQSITPHDAGCQDWLKKNLEGMGFTCHTLPKGKVKNLFATYSKGEGPTVAFAGHTDVVSTGPASDWHSPPFQLTENSGKLTGRGVADMKGGIAAFLSAMEHFISHHPEFNGTIDLLITSAEEGDDYMDGTPVIMEHLESIGHRIDYCIVGEPSATSRVGDVIRIGRRGSLSCDLTILGTQGHVAYPDKAANPFHISAAALKTLTETVWDQGNPFFPPTTFQLTSLSMGDGSRNVIPGLLEVKFNLRFSTEHTADQLKENIEAILKEHHLNYHSRWILSGNPFLTDNGPLIDSVKSAISEICLLETECSTGGGTSDGRFIAPYGIEVVELGLPNPTIHQVNESVLVEDLIILSRVYERALEKLFHCH